MPAEQHRSHRIAAAAPALRDASRYDGGGIVGELHRSMEIRLSGPDIVLPMPPESLGERMIAAMSRMAGPVLLTAAFGWVALRIIG